MPRNLNTKAKNEVAKRLGTEPINIIEIKFGKKKKNIKLYADKDLSGIEGKILDLGNLDEAIKLRTGGSTASISVTLDDTKQDIKALLNKFDIHKKPVKVFQWFGGLDPEGKDLSDKFLLFEGEINSPIVWDEGERTVSFEIVTTVESQEVGFAPEEGQFPNVPSHLTGQVWPLCFGDVVHVPAVKSSETVVSTLGSMFGSPDRTLPLKRDYLIERLEFLVNDYYNGLTMLTQATRLAREPIEIEAEYLAAIIEQDTRRQAQEDRAAELEAQGKLCDDLKKVIAKAKAGADREKLEEEFNQKCVIDELTQEETLEEIETLIEDTEQEIEDRKMIIEELENDRTFFEGNQEKQDEIDEDIKFHEDQLVRFETFLVKLEARQDDLRLKELKIVKENLEKEQKSAQYSYKIRGTIRTKLDKIIENALETELKIIEILSEIEDQKKLPSGGFFVNDASDFPGGVLQLLINQLVFEGFFIGNNFNITQVLPRYSPVQLGVRQGDDLDAFWVADETVDLKGLYCLMNDGRVFKVKDQVGKKVVFEIKEIEREDRKEDEDQKFPDEDDLLEATKLILNDAEDEDGNPIVGEHTEKEKTKILLDSIKDTEEGKKLKSLEKKIKDLKNKIKKVPFTSEEQKEEGKQNQDISKTLQQSIFDSMTEYNNRLRNMKYPKEAVEKAEQLISDKEFKMLLKLQQLNILETLRADDPFDEDAQTMVQEAIKEALDDLEQANPDATDEEKDEKALEAAQEILEELYQERGLPSEELSKLRFYLVGPEIDKIGIAAAAPIMPLEWLPNSEFRLMNKFPPSTFWVAQPSDEVKLLRDYQDKYIANILPSEVFGVYAFQDVNGQDLLAPVPSQYYFKNEFDTSFGTIIPTSITLKKPLREYKEDNWNEGKGLFVTLRSYIGNNTTVIIDWIIRNYTNLSVDSPSFFKVFNKIKKFPSNFALLDKRDALQLIEDIAWQARCEISIKLDKVFINYLPVEPNTVATITESDVETKSLSMTFTESEEVVTKLKGEWLAHYAQERKNTVILRSNIKKYGSVPEDFDFFIYNIRRLVLKAATFWLIRYSNTYKRITFKTFNTKLKVQTLDAVKIDFANDFFSNSAVTGIVEKADYNSDEHSITMTVLLPVRAGEMTQYPFFWPGELAANTLFPTIEDMDDGFAGNPINQTVPTGNSFTVNPNQSIPQQLELRPKDYGEAFPADTAFITPNSPIEGFSETDLVTFKPKENTLSPEDPISDERENEGFEDDPDEPDVDNKFDDIFIGRVTAVEDSTPCILTVRKPDNQEVPAQYKTEPDVIAGIQDVVTCVWNRQLGIFEVDKGPSNEILEVILVEVLPDTLIVKRKEDGEDIGVAKPYTLRQTPFDGEGIYTYTSPFARTGTITEPDEEGEGGETEDQEITPPYEVGQPIYIGRCFNVASDDEEQFGPDGGPLPYIDLNTDGRAWAALENEPTEPEPEPEE